MNNALNFGTGFIDYGFLKRPRLLFENVDPTKTPPPGPVDAKDKEIADLKAKLAALETKPDPKPDPKPDDLAAKAEKERIEKEKKDAESKAMETALKFTLQSAEWIKANASLLPKTIEGIFAQAEKEVYASAIEKANAIKVGIVSEFFAVQGNLDLLTEAQKNTLAEFKSWTQNVKQERVQMVYDTVFEPTFENMKRVKRAEKLSKGLGDETNAQEAYTKRLAELSQKHYLKKGRN